MPHVSIKIRAGKPDDRKTEFAEAVTRELERIFGTNPDEVSVKFEDVLQENWKEQVYDPEIVNGPGTLYKHPGYTL